MPSGTQHAIIKPVNDVVFKTADKASAIAQALVVAPGQFSARVSKTSPHNSLQAQPFRNREVLVELAKEPAYMQIIIGQ